MPRRHARRCAALLLAVACNSAGDGGTASISGGIGSASVGETLSGSDASSTGGTTTDATTGTSAGDPTTSSTDASAGTTGAADTSSGGDPGPGATCPPVGAPDCSVGPGSGEGDTCFDLPSCFLGTVKSAVTSTLDAHPEWFDYTDGSPLVIEVESYMNTVVETVAAQDLCAIRDPNAGDEIAVKHDQSGAESFDILTADGHARYGDGIYTAVCSPAWF